VIKLLAENREATRLDVQEKFEAGIVFTGAEVKSLRQRQGRLNAAFIRVVLGELLVFGMHIGRYGKSGSSPSFQEDRVRKLLLKRNEINRLSGLLSQKGLVCVPLKLYSKNGFLKIEIGVGRVLKKWQKKAKIIERQDIRDASRILKEDGR